MIVHRFLFFMCLPFVSFGSTADAANEPSATPAPNTARCESPKPCAGITADDIMKIKYSVKYTKYARDYQGRGTFKLIPQNNLVRSRYWRRYRIMLDKASSAIDYKDLLVILGPQNIKGVSVLTWTYRSPDRDQDVWAWIPSMRKVRRISASEEADPYMGSDFTTEEIATRTWEDERYALLGEKTFAGHRCAYHTETIYKDLNCYVVEAKPVREKWYYSKRIAWLDKQFGGLIFDEVFDPAGKSWKNFVKEYEVFDNGCIAQIFIEAQDLTTTHRSVIGFKKEDIVFNSNLQEGFFSEKTLMRSKW